MSLGLTTKTNETAAVVRSVPEFANQGEEELLVAARGGDPRAFEALVMPQTGRILHIAQCLRHGV